MNRVGAVAPDSGRIELFSVGKATIQKIHEMHLYGFTLTQLLPAMNEHLPERHPDWLPPGSTDGGHALLSIHSWLVRHDGMTILIDTGAGNDKSRPQQKVLDHLKIPFLDRLAAAGGDVMHHPWQLYDTELVSSFCEFPEVARRSRRSLLNQSAKDQVLYLSAHFPLSSAGRLTKNGKGFHWVFADDD